jgi:formylglycine-generating enzyme required for sulfatase activity
LGKYELTQAQWESVMGTTPWVGQDFVQANGSHPAVYISWDDMQTFVGRLNEAAGEALYRLPTEAEWEYAARAGTTTRWSFGEDESRLGDYAWYRANAWDAGLQYGQPVGSKLPNPWGLYDMHGNVWEWCQDWYVDSYYSGSSSVDPTGPTTGSDRVLRGGDFAAIARVQRSANRFGFGPGFRLADIGVRLLRMAEPIPLSTGDAEIIGEIEEDTGDAEIIGEME